MKRALFVYASIIAVICMVASCATFNKIVTNNELISQLAVQAATARVLHDYPEWKATTVGITDGAIRAISSRDVVSLEELEAYVRDRVKWYNLTPEEQALVSVLISNTRRSLEDSFRAHGIAIPEKEMLAVKDVMIWINEAAKRQ